MYLSITFLTPCGSSGDTTVPRGHVEKNDGGRVPCSGREHNRGSVHILFIIMRNMFPTPNFSSFRRAIHFNFHPFIPIHPNNKPAYSRLRRAALRRRDYAARSPPQGTGKNPSSTILPEKFLILQPPAARLADTVTLCSTRPFNLVRSLTLPTRRMFSVASVVTQK
jgi:hypothetical protein